MRSRALSDVARVVGGRLAGSDVDVSGVVTDSRLAVPGSLFVGLPGSRTDGSLFASDALANGAVAVLVHEGVASGGPAVFVRSTGDALIELAADERTRLEATVVGVAGANGKTSTKDMTAAVVSSRFRTHASPESFNNEIGLPLTLLGAPPEVEVIVAEIGARHVGDAAALCRIARPDVVVVTNVGVAHMEVFGSWDKIVEASAEPVEALAPEGLAILNADDPLVSGYAARCRGRVVTFGSTSRHADIRARHMVLGSDGRARLEMEHGDERAVVELSVPGDHMVSNALAAAAVGVSLGVGLESCAVALSSAAISHWRMETFTTSEGIRVVNDAYNANPESMAAALKTARWMAGEGHLIAVLGEMAELGSIARESHEQVGRLAARIRVDRLVTVGEGARSIAVAGIQEGIEPENVASYEHAAEALDDVRRSARPGDVVLVKASRVAGLESLAESLR